MGSKKPVFVSISLDFFIKYNTALLIPCAAFHNWTGSIFACVILWFQTFVSGFVHCVLALSSMFSSFPFSVFQSSPHKADMLSGISSSLSFSLTSYKLPSPFASPPQIMPDQCGRMVVWKCITHLFPLLFKNVINSEHACYKISILIVIFLYCIKIKIFCVVIFLLYWNRETCPNGTHCHHHYIYFVVELWLVLSHSQKEAALHIRIC